MISRDEFNCYLDYSSASMEETSRRILQIRLRVSCAVQFAFFLLQYLPRGGCVKKRASAMLTSRYRNVLVKRGCWTIGSLVRDLTDIGRKKIVVNRVRRVRGGFARHDAESFQEIAPISRVIFNGDRVNESIRDDCSSMRSKVPVATSIRNYSFLIVGV